MPPGPSSPKNMPSARNASSRGAPIRDETRPTKMLRSKRNAPSKISWLASSTGVLSARRQRPSGHSVSGPWPTDGNRASQRFDQAPRTVPPPLTSATGRARRSEAAARGARSRAERSYLLFRGAGAMLSGSAHSQSASTNNIACSMASPAPTRRQRTRERRLPEIGWRAADGRRTQPCAPTKSAVSDEQPACIDCVVRRCLPA